MWGVAMEWTGGCPCGAARSQVTVAFFPGQAFGTEADNAYVLVFESQYEF